MKKPTEIDNQELTELVGRLLAERDARIAALERRLAILDPPKPPPVDPFPIGSAVYSVIDLEARHDLIVRGFHRPGYITVTVLPGEPDRELPLQSVRQRNRCPHAETSPSEAFSNIADPKARAFFESRERARVEATTKPWSEPIAEQRRYS